MTDRQTYYTAPPDEIFDDIKIEAIKIWATYDDTYGYATEKIEHLRHILNVSDNWMFMVAMFDNSNREKLLESVEPETRDRILEAMS